MSFDINVSGFLNCSNPNFTHIGIFTPIPSYYATMFGVYFLPIVVILGIAGNVVSIIILNRAAKTISSNFYLWWLGIFDIVSLSSYLPSFWAVILMRPYYYYVRGPQYPATWIEYVLLGKYVCQLRMFVTFTARTCSVYAIVLVTIERFIMVVFPLKRNNICTVPSAKLAVTIMVMTACLINFPWIFTFDVISKPCFPLGICIGNTILLINRMIEFTILSLIPCVVIVISNGCIIYTLHHRSRLNILSKSKANKKQERDITIRLLAVSFAFFFLTIPSLVIISIHTVKQINNNDSYLRGPEADAFALSIILFAVNLAINFIIYCLTGKVFRKAALALLKFKFDDMRKYQTILATEVTAVTKNNRFELKQISGRRCQSLDFSYNKLIIDNLHQKRSLISL